MAEAQNSNTPKWHDLGLSYAEALHGMQTGVLYELNLANYPEDEKDRNAHKHFRVGINSAMIDSSALAWLLIRKGIISEAEYREELRLVANNEVWLYESRHQHRHPGLSFR